MAQDDLVTHAKVPGAIRVGTVNLFAQHGDWNQRRHALREGLRNLDADILALQEAIVDSEYDMVREILGADYEVVHQTQGLIGDGSHRGSSVASRLPILSAHEVNLHLTNRTWDYSCGTVILAIQSGVGRLLVGSHGSSWARWAERERELQAVAVVRRLDELLAEEPAHVILGGDFNAEPHASSVRFFTGRQSLEGMSTAYRDAWEAAHGSEPGNTFDPANPLCAIDEPAEPQGRRIDYILIRSGDHGPTLQISAAGLALNQPVNGVQASDHYGVYADLLPPAHAMVHTANH